jgi:hypothetical protein
MDGHVVIQVFSSCGGENCFCKELGLKVLDAVIDFGGQAEFGPEALAEHEGELCEFGGEALVGLLCPTPSLIAVATHAILGVDY